MIGVVGVNHRAASLRLRERLVFSEEEIADLIHRLAQGQERAEGVVLCTCNRTEVYYHLPESCPNRDSHFVIGHLAGSKGIREDLSGCFYSFHGEQAVTHLFQVAAGLDSMVLGEKQILGQVKDAYRISASRKLTGIVLNRLFHRAFEVGKKVRSDTAISEGSSSVGYAAVELAARIFSNLENHPVLLVGAGETGELVLRSLVERGNRHVHIANRTFSRAQELAGTCGGEAARLADLPRYLAHCDIVITSTASPQPLIRPEMVRGALQGGQPRTLFFIDLSVPRDVDEEVRRLDNVFVYDLDDLKAVVERNQKRRQGEVEKAQRIIDQYTADFSAWLSSLNLQPTISGLRDKLAAITRDELESLKHRMSEAEYEKVFQFADFLQGKYLGLVIRNLKKLSDNGTRLEYVDLVNDLFELHGKGGR